MNRDGERLALAAEHFRAGRLADAEALCRSVLAETPTQPHALHLVGLIAHHAGRHQDAVTLMTQALAVHGPEPAFHANLASACLSAGRFADAEFHARESLRLQPGVARVHLMLGVALTGQEKLADAHGQFHHALWLDPNLFEARRQLSKLLLRQGRSSEAAAELREVVRRAPDDAQARNDLAEALLADRQPEEAALELRHAVRLLPASAGAHGNLGMVLNDLSRFDEALACFQRALQLSPGSATAHSNLAYALALQGRTDEARAEYREALRLEPTHPGVIASLAKLAAVGEYPIGADDLARFQEVAARTTLPIEQLSALHFVLAKLLDRAGQSADAFTHLIRANALRKEICRRHGLVFDLVVHRRYVDRLIAAFDAAHFQRSAGFGTDSPLPVFVVGMPRSGTTLTEQILASHPQVHGAGELDALPKLAAALPQQLGSSDPYPECLRRLDRPTSAALAQAHVDRLARLAPTASHVVDKLPGNLLNVGLIATLFPRAPIIHCRRDPIDTCVSCFFLDFGAASPFALDLEHLGHYHRDYERLFAHWAKVLPTPMLEVRYEEMIANPEENIRRLIAFCGLPWDDRCLRFHETQRAVRTPSDLQVRQPIYRTAVGRWKRYEAQIEPLLKILRP